MKIYIFLLTAFLFALTQSETQAQRVLKRMTIGKMRALSGDAGGAAGQLAKEELQTYEAGTRASLQQYRSEFPGRAGNILGIGDSSAPKLEELIEDENAKLSIEDRRNKTRFPELMREWWYMDSDAVRRLKAEAERLRRLRANIDSSQYFVPKKIVVNGKPKDIVIYGKHMNYDGAKAYKSYNYQRLTYISYHSYDIDANSGKALNQDVVDAFQNTLDKESFINTVRNPKENKKAYDGSFCKVLLSISLHGEYNAAKFFANNLNAQQATIDSIVGIVARTDADGVELDFLDVPSLYRKEFINFVKKMSGSIRGLEIHNDSVNTYKYVFMNVPAYDNDNVYELRSLINDVDYFLLAGHTFHKNPKADNGLEKVPNSSLNYSIADQSFDMRAVLEKAIGEVGKYNRDMLIMVVPYFGTMWESRAATNELIDPAISYDEIILNYVLSDSLKRYRYEPSSNTYIWQNKDTSLGEIPIITTIYYDDTMSIIKKFDFVLKNRIGGVGLYPLGGSVIMGQHFWKLLDIQFTEFKAPDNEKLAKLKRQASFFEDNSVFILGILLYWGIFMTIGFVWSLFTAQTRQALFDSSRFRSMYMIFFTVLLIMLGSYYGVFQYHIVLLITGLLFGSIVSWSLLKALHKEQEDRP